jgi:hypothetical protein
MSPNVTVWVPVLGHVGQNRSWTRTRSPRRKSSSSVAYREEKMALRPSTTSSAGTKAPPSTERPMSPSPGSRTDAD